MPPFLSKISKPAPNLLLIAITYFLYFGQLGVMVPYLGVFLDGRGFNSVQIGELFAIITLARILGPNLWASIADKTGRTLFVLQLGCFLTVTCFCVIFFVNGFWGITLAFALMMMFWTAVIPQLEVITLNAVNSDSGAYSRIRLWGSIGFIVLTVLVGKSIDIWSSEAPVYISVLVLSGLFLSTLFIKSPAKAETEHQQGSIWSKLTTRVFICFIVANILLQVSFGTYYGFFALYLRDLGYSGQQTGILIALGVAAEIVIFLLAGSLIKRWGVKYVLIASLVLTALRWAGLAVLADFVFIVIVCQLLHAFSFGLTHAASMQFIHGYFGQRYQSRGQAIYVSISFGIGGAFGNYLAGLMWRQGEGAVESFLFSAGAAVLAAAVLLIVSTKRMNAAHQ